MSLIITSNFKIFAYVATYSKLSVSSNTIWCYLQPSSPFIGNITFVFRAKVSLTSSLTDPLRLNCTILYILSIDHITYLWSISHNTLDRMCLYLHHMIDNQIWYTFLIFLLDSPYPFQLFPSLYWRSFFICPNFRDFTLHQYFVFNFFLFITYPLFFSSLIITFILLNLPRIQGVSRLQSITAGADFLGLCDEKSSYKHVSDFGHLRSYDRLKLRTEGNDY